MGYIVKAVSADGGGAITFPVGTIFPPQRDPEYNEAGRIERTRDSIPLEGRYQLGGATAAAAAQANAAAFFTLFDFARTAGRVQITITLDGAGTIYTFQVHARGPRLRNVRLVQRPGSLATHAHFYLEIEDPRDKEFLGEKASNVRRVKEREQYRGRTLSTTYRAGATGEGAQKLVEKWKPKDDAGPIREVRMQRVDEMAYEIGWTIETPHKVGSYLSWERVIRVQEGGYPIAEIPILGPASAEPAGPILRRAPRQAARVTDTNTITTLTTWIEAAPEPPALFGSAWRDDVRSDRLSPYILVDPIRGIRQRTAVDHYVGLDAAAIKAALKSFFPTLATITEVQDPGDWLKVR